MMPYADAASAAPPAEAGVLALLLLPTVWLLIYTAHRVMDHWCQTTHQARHKGRPGVHGALVCLRHAAAVTAGQGVAVLGVAVPLAAVAAPGASPITPASLACGLSVTLVSHWWIDRRTTLQNLATALSRAEFYQFGAALGSGAYALDQDAHRIMLIPAAVMICAPTPPVLATTAALTAVACGAAVVLARVGAGMDADAQVARALRE